MLDRQSMVPALGPDRHGHQRKLQLTGPIALVVKNESSRLVGLELLSGPLVLSMTLHFGPRLPKDRLTSG